MSWDKNTIISSEVDSIIKTLTDVGVPYVVGVMTQVAGRGLNDDICCYSEDDECKPKMYPLRKLTYGDWVILEQMVRTEDCDSDDYIISHKFIKGQEPKDFQYEIQEQDETPATEDKGEGT